MSNEMIGYQNEKGEVIDPPRLSRDRDVWLKETVALLSEASTEMVQVMAKNPKECGPFLRLFSLITHLAADTKAVLQQGQPPIIPPIAPPSPTSHNGDMDARVAQLENFAIETRDRLTRIESTMSTKADVSDVRVEMHKEFHSTTWKIIGSQAALVAVVYFIVKYVAA